MAYEYEGYIKNTIRTEAVFSHEIEQKYDRILELEEVYRKTKAFNHIKVIYDKNMNEMSISDAECIEMIGNELERADDER
ncbi:hypothetical protein [Staphylococcus equorum]|uniref:hypothetical protein n=1 Tax=Staphylococcus equorum TaxID=246432 RepID=UPI003CECECEA